MSFLLKFHGELRWLVALAAIVAVARFSLGWARRTEFTRLDRVLMAVFKGLLALNLVLGASLLFGLGGGWPSYRIEHATTMFLAVAVAHASAIWRRVDDPVKKYRGYLISVVLALALVVLGVVRLRSGWIF